MTSNLLKTIGIALFLFGISLESARSSIGEYQPVQQCGGMYELSAVVSMLVGVALVSIIAVTVAVVLLRQSAHRDYIARKRNYPRG